MRVKLFAAGLLLSVANGYAQKGVEDGSRFGHGEDSIRCVVSLNQLSGDIKSENYPDAEKNFNIVYSECPGCSENLYVRYAPRIFSWKMKNEKDSVKRGEILKQWVAVFDKQIKYFGENGKNPTGWIIGEKARIYFGFSNRTDIKVAKQAYDWFKQSMELQKERTDIAVLVGLMQASDFILKKEATHKEQFMKDFMAVNSIIDEIEKMEGKREAGPGGPGAPDGVRPDQGKDKPEGMNPNRRNSKLEGLTDAKGLINQLFATSSAASCETLAEIYGPQVEANKTNGEFLSQVIRLLKRCKCTESELYLQVSTYMFKIKPTAESAQGMAQQALKNKDFESAISYFKQAMSMEANNEDKAEDAHSIALLYAQNKQYSQSRDFARQAIGFARNYGKSYILIGQLYAMSAKGIYPDDPVMQRTVYYAAFDKMVEAKQADPGCAAEADKWMSEYRQQFPSKDDVFMHPELESGKAITVGGWIQERTTVR
ncbi:MAG: hypothetical protein PHI48_00330 [Bacteroidales bacterium]|nr:hypothetical protein [Bacteroidales bacterium]